MAESWKKLKTSNVFWLECLFVLESKWISSSVLIVVGQLYEDKSLLLHTLDLIIFTIDLK